MDRDKKDRIMGYGALAAVALAFGVVAVLALFAIFDVIDAVSGAFRKGQK